MALCYYPEIPKVIGSDQKKINYTFLIVSLVCILLLREHIIKRHRGQDQQNEELYLVKICHYVIISSLEVIHFVCPLS
jgi:hypothetical protein